MKRCLILLLVAVYLPLVQLTVAQTPTETASALPRLVRFGGTVRDASGNPLTGVVGITFALYSEQSGGAALWLETQNITADSNGRYTALLGATRPEGLPAILFTNEQAHWVGVQVEGRAEQPRVLLVSSPYALKAGDAETIGGLPPSAFVLAAPSASGSAAASSPAAITAGSRDLAPTTAADVTTTGGTANYLPIFTGTSTILDSVVYQSGTGSTAKVGINTSTPASTLDVKGAGTIRGALTLPTTGAATATASYNSEPLNLAASVFNSGTGTAAAQTFQLKAEPVRNDTATASGVLSLLYASGANAPGETGLQIASSGVISFATGQTFPGAGGTITGVTAGTDLTGGGTTGTVTLNLDTAKVPQLAAANTFTASQAVNGSVSATSFSGSGSALTNLQGANVQGAVATAANALNLGGFAPSAYQPAGSYATTGSNAFTGNQSVTGNVTATGSVSGAAATFTGLVTEAGALLPASGTATTAQGYNSQPLDSVTSAYNSGTASAQSQDFRWLAEPVGNDTSSPSGKLDLLFGTNGATPAETGLSVASNGVISFASGQTFPGAGSGTVTSVGSGAGLTGGPITTSGSLSIATGGVSNAMLANPSLTVSAGTDLTGGGSVALGGSTTLNLDTTRVPQLAAANTFTANQTVSGSVTATSFSGNGSALTNLQGANVQGAVATAANALDLGGLAPSAYATTGGNAFTGNQGVTGNVTATGGVTAGGQVQGGVVSATTSFDIGGVPVIQAQAGGSNNFSAGLGVLPPTTTGTYDTAVGDGALAVNTTGSYNAAAGSGALSSNTAGNANAASGYYALFSNTAGNANTGTGFQALFTNTTGSYNTADGDDALYYNVGSYNTASGNGALYLNTTGNNNTASGLQALYSNTTASSNTAVGYTALHGNSTGSNNTAIGNEALWQNTTGSNNIAIGSQAGLYVTGSNNIHVGNAGASGDSGAIRIGISCPSSPSCQTSAFIAGIYGVTTIFSNAVPVMVDSNGNLGTISSSRRYKEDIQDMGDASGGLMRLRPVTFRYKKPFSDGSQPIQYGLIAEEVAEVYPDLVARSADGQIETVKYQVLGPMLLNELQKENITIAAQKEQIQAQQQQIQAQQQQIQSLEERLARVEAALQRFP
jgi:hypothetical protein